MTTINRRKLTSQKGASLTEYALTVGLIAVVCIGAINTVGQGFMNGWEGLADCMEHYDPEICGQISMGGADGPK